MGYEYRVKFTCESVAQVDEFLRALICFDSFDAERQTYIYRTSGNRGAMPDAEMSIEPNGLYLCDYGIGMHEFGFLVKKLLSYFTSVQIEEL
ncbi:MAG TPA: hypothetical protein VGB77_03230 [Abditibacteriaceae bacterium]|jgi:hypothetical protein